MKQPHRQGFSLLEVLLATTVLLGCAIVLAHLAFVGRSHMESAEQLSAAQMACQTRMNQMLVGSVPIQAVAGEPIAGLPGWGLSVKVESAARPGLLALEVTAFEAPDSLETSAGGGKQFTLVRWIAQPGSNRSNRRGQRDPAGLAPDWTLPGGEDLPPLPDMPDIPGLPPFSEDIPVFDPAFGGDLPLPEPY